MSLLCHLLRTMRYLMYQPAMLDITNHASARRQAQTDGSGGGEKESSVPELCTLESVCGQACIYRHIARCVFTTIMTILINRKFSSVFKIRVDTSCSGDASLGL